MVSAGALAAGCAAARSSSSRPNQVAATPVTSVTKSAIKAGTPKRPSAVVVPGLGSDPVRLAVQITEAEKALSGRATPEALLLTQALTLQIACLKLAAHRGWAGQVISAVPPAWRAAVAADLNATADLVALTPPEPRLPPWRLIPALSLGALRADYQAAQADTGVRWFYLAAINFVETDFGRIVGPSSAGAQGPMQFMPATWAAYGHGDIYDPRAAIIAAARYLAAHGASSAIGPALYAYNPSSLYVDAVLRYAARIRASSAALTGYYNRQILYHLGPGWVWLPPGYGARRSVRAISIHL